MNSSQQKRMFIIAGLLALATLVVVGRLFAFQVLQDEIWAQKVVDQVTVVERPQRGIIFDRNGAVLAANKADYQIGVSPNLINDPDEMANQLSPILQRPRYEILAALESGSPYVLLEGRVSAEVADAIRNLDDTDGLQLDPLPRRFYPQGDLLCHVLGYVDFDNNGGGGVEGYYQSELAGEAASGTVNISPLEEQTSVTAREGADIVLTIDRTVQYTVERHLQEALAEYGAVSGTIIVMNPRSGAVLAMASEPCYSPDKFYETEESLLLNPMVSKQFEPGSVMKIITMAAALDSGTVNPNSTYQDNGVLEVGGHRTVNWDRSAPGTVDMTTLLSRSLNVGAATLATWMGPDVFYNYMQRFNFGRPTGIDLMSEASGLMPLPGSELWTESLLATDSYGQGLAVTPLQMTAAAAALANNGYLMQPYVVQEIHGSNGVFVHEPTVLSQAVSPEAAQQVTAMMVTAVSREVQAALVPGYTVAGKTGTAQIAENGIYHPTDVIGTFIGWLPADAPEIVIFVKLDRPTSAPWGSQTAAPAFSKLAQELVVLLDIPPDEARLKSEIAAARENQ